MTVQNLLSVPDPVSRYFDADAQDPAFVAACFTEGGHVVDEGHTHLGREAIALWKIHSARKYEYRAEPLQTRRQASQWWVTARVTGNFPGSPIKLTYRFQLEGDLIAALVIGQ